MFCSLSRLFALAGSGLTATAFAFPVTVAAAQEGREIIIQRIVLDGKEGQEGNEKKEKEDDDDDKEQTAFWMGVALEGTEGASGLKIAEVLPNSPASKSGLKSGDVLVAIGEKKLDHLEQLIDLVQDSKGRGLKVKVLREGQERVIEVKPGKRPNFNAIEEREGKEEKHGKEGKEKKFEQGGKRELNRYIPNLVQPGAPNPAPYGAARPSQPSVTWRPMEGPPKAGGAQRADGGGIQMFAVPYGNVPGAPTAGGGSAFPPATSWGASGSAVTMPGMAIAVPQAQLPEDMEVTVSKKGAKPAVVTARHGDKFWKTTENELGMLPPPAQAYAARLLGKDVMRARMPFGGNPGMGNPGMGSSGMGLPGAGMMMQTMPGAPALGMPGQPPRREMRAIELRLTKDGKAEAIQEGQPAPHVKVLPGGDIQVEIREQAGKDEKEEKKERRTEKSAAEKEDPARAERIRDLQQQVERLRELLNRLREEVKEKN